MNLCKRLLGLASVATVASLLGTATPVLAAPPSAAGPPSTEISQEGSPGGGSSPQYHPVLSTCYVESEPNNSVPIKFRDVDSLVKIEFEGSVYCDNGGPDSVYLTVKGQRWDGSQWRTQISNTFYGALGTEYMERQVYRGCTNGYWRTESTIVVTHGNTAIGTDRSNYIYIQC